MSNGVIEFAIEQGLKAKELKQKRVKLQVCPENIRNLYNFYKSIFKHETSGLICQSF